MGKRRKPRPYIGLVDHALIPLTKGLFAKVSLCDAERVSQFLWCASREGRKGLKWYAVRFEGRTKIRMHRFIMDRPPGTVCDMCVDHLNDDSLDNRRSNLELVTQAENMRRCKNWVKKAEEPFL